MKSNEPGQNFTYRWWSLVLRVTKNIISTFGLSVHLSSSSLTGFLKNGKGYRLRFLVCIVIDRQYGKWTHETLCRCVSPFICTCVHQWIGLKQFLDNTILSEQYDLESWKMKHRFTFRLNLKHETFGSNLSVSSSVRQKQILDIAISPEQWG